MVGRPRKNKPKCKFLKTQTGECTYKTFNNHIKGLPKCLYKDKKECPVLMERIKFEDTTELNSRSNN